jgi:Winged helix DNA-binding domain
MPERAPTLRELNRATLAHQMLLDRETFLVDGFVGGTWKIEETGKAARLVIEPFGPLSESDRDALLEDGERLVRFGGDGAEAFEVRFTQGV